MTEDVRLFSYGTLQQPEVQRANFGRLLDGEEDALIGYRLESIEIDDPAVVEISGKATHSIACQTGDPADWLPGTVFRITQAELAATDVYEVAAYTRVEASLASGGRAWVYVRSAPQQSIEYVAPFTYSR